MYVEFGVASTDSIREGFIKVLTSPKRGERGFSQSRLKIRSFFEWLLKSKNRLWRGDSVKSLQHFTLSSVQKVWGGWGVSRGVKKTFTEVS